MEINKKINYVSLWLLGICVFVFIIQNLFPEVVDFFILDKTKPLELWRFIGSIFLHGSLGHLLSNMIALGIFGLVLESIIGSKRFTYLYFASGIVANIGAIILYDRSLGASGAIMGVLGTLVVIRPLMVVWVAGVPAPMIIAGAFWIFSDFIGLFDQNSNVASLAHLFGMAAGLLYGLSLRLRAPRKPRNNIRLDEDHMRRWEDFYMR